MPVMQRCAPDSPLMKAWANYQETEDFQNSFSWVKGALWAAFMEGFKAATERAAGIHEQVNPASDMERLDKVPGAGAMGAVIEYRDTIRRES